MEIWPSFNERSGPVALLRPRTRVDESPAIVLSRIISRSNSAD
jgi:hypothetical protein